MRVGGCGRAGPPPGGAGRRAASAAGAAGEELTSMHRAIVEKAGALARVTTENVSLQQHLEAERQRCWCARTIASPCALSYRLCARGQGQSSP